MSVLSTIEEIAGNIVDRAKSSPDRVRQAVLLAKRKQLVTERDQKAGKLKELSEQVHRETAFFTEETKSAANPDRTMTELLTPLVTGEEFLAAKLDDKVIGQAVRWLITIHVAGHRLKHLHRNAHELQGQHDDLARQIAAIDTDLGIIKRRLLDV